MRRTVDVWTKGKFLLESGYYAGRGPTRSDLNSEILEMFYTGIKNGFGKEAASNFVRFVNGLNDLSASAFIVAFERFAHGGFRNIAVRQRPEDGYEVSGNDDARHAQAFAIMANAFGRPRRSEEELRQAHESIKCQFILSHQREIPANEQHEIARHTFGF